METCLCECDICRGSLYVPSEDRTECECLPVANCTEYMNGHPTDNDDWENSSENPNEDGAGYCSCQGCKGGYELVKGGEQNVCCKKIDNCSEYNTDCGCTKCVDGYEPENGGESCVEKDVCYMPDGTKGKLEGECCIASTSSCECDESSAFVLECDDRYPNCEIKTMSSVGWCPGDDFICCTKNSWRVFDNSYGEREEGDVFSCGSCWGF